MPCRVTFTCPSCGQECGQQFTLAQAVANMEKAFLDLREHHAEVETNDEKWKDLYEKQSARTQEFKLKATQAETRLKEVKTDLSVIMAKKIRKSIELASDDELIAELAKRRQ